MRRLLVYLADEQVGDLALDASGELKFTYLPGARPISASLPVREEPYEEGECGPFFEGVLPEDAQRLAIERAMHVGREDIFSLLEHLGGEVAGALRLLPEGVDQAEGVSFSLPAPLSDLDLDRLIRRLPLRPMLIGEGALRLSLAGAQTKLPVCLSEGRVRLPAPGEPTTHILKPAISRFPGTTENEAFVMRLAAAVGLPAAKVEARRLEGEQGPLTYLLVERYDRVVRDGRVVRLHQEDFCQALSLTSRYKYEQGLGPGLSQCKALILEQSDRPGADVQTFMDVVCFNLLVGNGDAHAKNFSLLYGESGPRLAPFYDLLSTLVYPDLDPTMAMAIGGKFRFAEIDRQVLETGSKALRQTRTYLGKRLDRLRSLLPQASEDVAQGLCGQGLDDAMLEGLMRLVRNRVARFEAEA